MLRRLWRWLRGEIHPAKAYAMLHPIYSAGIFLERPKPQRDLAIALVQAARKKSKKTSRKRRNAGKR